MTGHAIARKCRVVRNRGRHPGRTAVAQITLSTGSNMRRRFTPGGDVVMAAGTGADHLSVIHRRRRHRFPGYRTRRVTGVACRGGIHMSDRFGMAGTADTGDLGMIHAIGQDRAPQRRELVMAGIA